MVNKRMQGDLSMVHKRIQDDISMVHKRIQGDLSMVHERIQSDLPMVKMMKQLGTAVPYLRGQPVLGSLYGRQCYV